MADQPETSVGGGQPKNSDALASTLLRRYEKLKSERGNFEDLFQEVADYVLPRKSNITVIKSRGEKQTQKLYDSTAMHANQLLAAALQSTLTSSAIKWFQLLPRNQELARSIAVQKWLDDCRDRMLFHFQTSNFDPETHELYLDLGAFGTGCIASEEKESRDGRFAGFVFRFFDISEYMIAENAEGFVDSVYRAYLMEARQIAQKFGIDNLGENYRKTAINSPYDMLKILHAVCPREDFEYKNSNIMMPFASFHLAVDEKQGNKILRESGYHEFPYSVPRWEKTSGERWGRSPAMIALPDTRSLNKAIELELKAWAKVLDPPMKVLDDGVIGQVRLVPGGLTSVREMDAIAPIISGADFRVSNLKEEQLKRAIEREFFIDVLQLPPAQGTPMTATEVERRIEQMNRVLGPMVGRLKSEFMKPLIDRCFAIMLRAKAFADMPDEMVAARMEGKQDLDIEFLGPLARAQKASDVIATGRWLDSFVGLTNLTPDIMDNVDTDFIPRNNARLLGVPAEVLRSVDDVRDIRKRRAEQQQAEIERMQGLQEAQVAANVQKVSAQATVRAGRE
jgi:hypothetical protein